MKKLDSKKLRLQTETLRSLETAEVGKVGGALSTLQTIVGPGCLITLTCKVPCA